MMICPVCKHNVDDADYWDEESGTCVRCALEKELTEMPLKGLPGVTGVEGVH